MQLSTSLCARWALACLATIACPASHAAITVFNTQASFLAAVSAPGVDSFAGLSTTSATPSPITRFAGPYSYSASSASGFFGVGSVGNPALSTNSDADAITFFNFGGGASGIGGLFFGSDLQGLPVAATVVLTATDTLGAIATRTVVANPNIIPPTFVGFVSNAAIATLVFSTSMPGQFVFPAVDDLTIAAAPVAEIPEPETWTLLLAGLGALGACARRRQSSRTPSA